MGIFDMIILSKKEVSLLYGFLSFWDTSINAFSLPFGMMSLTLYDVVVIMGLSIDGDELRFLHGLVNNDLGF